jgi:hypothetical protein
VGRAGKRTGIGAVVLAIVLLPPLVGPGSAGLRDNCTTPVFENGLDAVFGRTASQAAADVVTNRADTLGFKGLKTVRESCGIWESVLRGLSSFDVAVDLQNEARRVGLDPTIECVTAQQIDQLQAIFGTRPTLEELQFVIDRAKSFGYVGLKTKTAPCGGYQAYVAGFDSRAEADSFAEVATERTGLQVTIIRA